MSRVQHEACCDDVKQARTDGVRYLSKPERYFSMALVQSYGLVLSVVCGSLLIKISKYFKLNRKTVIVYEMYKCTFISA